MSDETVTAEELAELRAIADEAAKMDRQLIDVGVIAARLADLDDAGLTVCVPAAQIAAQLRKALQ